MASSLNGTGVSFSDGSSQSIAWVGLKSQLFTASGTFTVPAGVTSVKVTCIGGGGGASQYWGIGGYQGGFAIGVYTVTPGAAITVTVGAGSASINTSGIVPTAGTSSFGAFCSATGATGVGSGSGSNGRCGVGTGGNISNTTARQERYFAINSFAGSSPNSNGSSAAIVYSVTSGTVPGAGGYGSSGCANVGYGGTNGAVLVEW